MLPALSGKIRIAVLFTAVCIAAATLSPPVMAQKAWPTKPLTLIVPVAQVVSIPFGITGASDNPARTLKDDVFLVAVLRTRDGVAAEALHAWLRTRLPKFMVPRYVELCESLPKTGSGKVEKFKLSATVPAGAWDSQLVAVAAH